MKTATHGWFLMWYRATIVSFFLGVTHLLCVCRVKLRIGSFYLSFILINYCSPYRVKYYCSTCCPRPDDLTESQLNHMQYCLHGEYTLLSFLYSIIYLVEQTDSKIDEKTSVSRQSFASFKSEHAVVWVVRMSSILQSLCFYIVAIFLTLMWDNLWFRRHLN
jgi:hypothetical protein